MLDGSCFSVCYALGNEVMLENYVFYVIKRFDEMEKGYLRTYSY